MAHQAHNIPWHILASNLRYKRGHEASDGATNLAPKYGLGLGEQFTYFVDDFHHTISGFTRAERAKYRSQYEPPELNELVIPRETVRRIEPTVQRYRSDPPSSRWNHDCVPSAREGSRAARNSQCRCPLEAEKTRMSWWMQCHEHCHRVCSRSRGQEFHQDAVELIKALLLHNEMDALFRIAAHPDVNLATPWFAYPPGALGNFGWGELLRSTLMAYICLNVLLVKQETDPGSDAGCPSEEGYDSQPVDYRGLKCYQRMLFRCTATHQFDTITFLHRDFLGSPRGVNDSHFWKEEGVFGKASLKEIRRSRWDARNPNPAREAALKAYLPTRKDVWDVLTYLGKLGLPPELSLLVLEQAGYAERRKCPVPDEPLNHENKQELRDYLDECWRLLVRANMLVEACGKWVNWPREVATVIDDLWSEQPNGLVEYLAAQDGSRVSSQVLGLFV